MKKRVSIFSLEKKDREQIFGFVQEYFSENFKEFYPDLEIIAYSGFNEPPGNDQLGHREEKEILAIADKQITPAKDRYKGNPRYALLKGSFDGSVRLCEQLEIPFVLYEGEIPRGIEFELQIKFDRVKGQIKKRLEGRI